MEALKKYQFWVSVILSVIFFAVIYPLSVSPYTGAYYVLVFNGISIICFASVLYHTLTKSFTKNKIKKLISLIIISSLPHLIFVLLSYGSWVCLGVAIIITLILMWYKNKITA